MNTRSTDPEALQRAVNAHQIILSTKGHVSLEDAGAIVDAALDAGRAEVYQLIANLATIAAEALAAAAPDDWAHRQQRLIIGAQIAKLENTPNDTLEPPC